MRLGIDFGTTRIVAAVVDRGNYPVVAFDCPDGASRDWFPPLVAVVDGERRYGWEAWTAQASPRATVVRSLKRLLGEAGPASEVSLGEERVPMGRLLAEMMGSLREALGRASTLDVEPAGRLGVMLGVPANANSNQRFLTVEAFREAGFDVLGLLNEPSAASVEFSHRQRAAARAGGACVLVYDLGGGTFDASLVRIDARTHAVLGTEGIGALGGDDFDEALAELALEAAGIRREEWERLTPGEQFRLNEECRERKETLSPNTRRIAVDLEGVREGWGEVRIPVLEYFERCRPLIDDTLQAVEGLLAAHGYGPDGTSLEAERPLEAVYVTGGGSELPLVARALRERFGRKVRRSAQARAATAIGLGIQADTHAGYVLRERFTRHFGVWREAEAGQRVAFDRLFPKGTPLPGAGEAPLVMKRRYAPVHNVGHFRYLECSQIAEDGEPRGDITVWDEIRFPFDPSLAALADLSGVEVRRNGVVPEQQVEECYTCDPSGAMAVTITSTATGLSRQYRLGRWADSGSVAPASGRRRSTARTRGRS